MTAIPAAVNGHRPAAPAALEADIDQIEATLRLFVRPGCIGEIRVKAPGRGMQGLYFGFDEIPEAARMAARASRTASACYVVINEISDTLADRQRLAWISDLTKNIDIARRRFVLIDLDPNRLPDLSSTDDQKQFAFVLMEAVYEWLRGLGFPDMEVRDSGNGYHILFAVDLPNDAESASLVEMFLKSLAKRFSTKEVKVDITVHNSSRITKLYGTPTRKGPNKPDTPHRLSGWVLGPDGEMEIVSRGLIQTVIDSGSLFDGDRLDEPSTTTAEPNNEQRPNHFTLPAKIEAGNRHGTLTKLAGVGRWVGMDEPLIYHLLQSVNQSSLMDGAKPDDEVRDIAKYFAGKDADIGLQALWNGETESAVETAQRQQRLKNGLAAATRKISDGQPVDQILIPLSKMMQELQQDLDGKKPFDLNMIDSRTFAAADYRQHFLVKKILAAGQPCMIGGPVKCLKTSVALDLMISLGTGTLFLGRFEVPKAVNVGIISGESGLFTLQRNAEVMAEQRSINLADALCFWGDTLPQITNPVHLAAVEEMIVAKSLKALLVDPAYLCILAGDTQGRSSSNVFDMGSILKALTEIGQRTGCTIILIHHNRKNLVNPFAIPTLQDMSGSGFAEWARQWILVNRREPYEQGTGIHRLWMTAGGSIGHDSAWSLDINEGVLDDQLSGRQWFVTATSAGEARHEEQQAKEAEKRLADEAKTTEAAREILKTLERYPDGQTVRGLRAECELREPLVKSALNMLRGSQEIEDCRVLSSNKQTYPGVKRRVE